ncbi:MAG: ABA4-like family protein [Blastocatellales bacterium]
MNPETLFSLANGLALIGWILLIFAPRWRWTSKLVGSGLIPLLLASVYLVLIVLFFGRAEGGFSSLAEVGKLFRNEWAVLTGWVHYLAFDLFIGSWELRDSQDLGISHLWIVPCLLLTFMLGPIGLLLYFAVSHRARSKESRL